MRMTAISGVVVGAVVVLVAWFLRVAQAADDLNDV